MKANLHERKGLRNRRHVFADRFEAGRVLAEMLAAEYREADDQVAVIAIPAGGVPVGLEISKALKVPLDIIIVRKIQIPGNTEAGFGAMTTEGSVFLNEDLISHLGLTSSQIEQQKVLVRKDLEEREKLFRGGSAPSDLAGKTVVLVDDGLATGYTMIASIDAVRNRRARRVVVAVPTAPAGTVIRIEDLVEEIYCANIRESTYFAVADAYEHWYDLDREEVLRLLKRGKDEGRNKFKSPKSE